MSSMFKGTIHGTISGKEDHLFLLPSLMAEMVKANYELTLISDYQDSNWKVVWKAKMDKAIFNIVIYSESYRNNLTPATLYEGRALLLKHPDGEGLFIYDPDARGIAPSSIRALLLDGINFMGDFKGWKKLIEGGVSTTSNQSSAGAAEEVQTFPPVIVQFFDQLSLSADKAQQVLKIVCSEHNGCTDVEEVKDLLNEDKECLDAVLAILPKVKTKKFTLMLTVLTDAEVAAAAGVVAHAPAAKRAEAEANGLNEQDEDGWTPLYMLSSCDGERDRVKALLLDGADPDIADRTGHTPLMNAALNGHDEVVQLLVDAGADVHLKSKGGETALDWAREENEAGCVVILEKAMGVK